MATPRREYHVISADSHTVEPPDLWETWLERKYLDTAPKLVEDRDGGTLPTASVPGGGGYAEGLATTRGDLGLVGRTLAGDWLLTVRGSAVLQDHRHRFGDLRERDRHASWFGEVSLTRQIGPAVVVVGGGVEADQYRNRTLPAFDYSFTAPGLFAQGEWTPADPLTLALAARLDHHSAYGTFLSPRLSGLLRLGGGWTARVSGGTGYFGPTPFTEETEATGLTPILPPDGLTAETAGSGAVDLGGVVGPLELNLTLFASTIHGAVRLAASGGQFRLVNAVEPSRTAGADLLLRYRQPPWHLTTTYTLVQATEGDPIGAGRRTVPLTPRHAAGLVAGWEREGQTFVAVELYFTGRQTLEANPFRTRSRPFTIVGALVQQRVAGVRLFLNLENLTDARQTRYDPLLLPVRAPDGRWTTDAWAPLDGRTINGGIRLAW